MNATTDYLAIDLGAESGRTIVGRFNGEQISLEVVHRFANGPTPVFGSLYWDPLGLYAEIRKGMALYAKENKHHLAGIGLDTWGVDFGLIGPKDTLLGNPHHYRDGRTNGMVETACKIVSRQEIFEQTGIQFMQINTLYQLLAMKLSGDPTLEMAQSLLMMPDLLNFWLTGIKAAEYSIVSTTQCYDPRQGTWAYDLLGRLGIPTSIFEEIIQPGTVVGTLLPDLADETGLPQVPVIAPASHDTGSAVAAVPASISNYAYISSGTWSLMGVETCDPIINEDTLRYNFTNEGGVCGTIRLLKNIMGLWLVQECRRTWANEGVDLDYNSITQMASEAPAFGPLVDPDDSCFLQPGDMPERIQEYCVRTGQDLPQSRGQIVRCALESLALKYRWVLEKLELMLGYRLDAIHIVGGGSQNRLLCQLAADATQRPVIAGPVEATAIGNILMQALASGELASLQEGRQVVAQSFKVTEYDPMYDSRWEEAYARFVALTRE